MTIVAIWKESDEEFLWSVADTRIGSTSGAGVLTENGSKLFVLPVTCRSASPELLETRVPHYTSAVGFAFAGSTLTATMVYAAASNCLQSLVSFTTRNPPTLEQIAALTEKLASRFVGEIHAASSGGVAEFAVFGWCPHNERFEVYVLKPSVVQTPAKLQMTQVLQFSSDAPVVLGSGRESFRKEMVKITQGGDRYGRTAGRPKLAVEQMILSQSSPDVGGSISLGVANRFRFDLYSSVQPVEVGKPQTKRLLNGLDLDRDIGPVGPYVIGMPGLV